MLRKKCVFVVSTIFASQMAVAVGETSPEPKESAVPNLQTHLPLDVQRQLYQKTAQLLPLAAQKQHFQQIDTMLSALQGYILTPYLYYQRLLLDKTQLSESRIVEFATQYPDIANQQELNRTLLTHLYQQQDWQAIRDFLARHPMDDVASQCIQLSAQLHQTPNAPSIWANVTALWQTGKSLPNQCDAILAQWQQAGQLTPALLRQRGYLAFLAGSDGLLRHLRNLAGDDIVSQNWLESLVQLREHPEQLTVFVQTAAITPENQAIVDRTFPRFLKKLDISLLDRHDPFAEFARWAERFHLGAEQREKWQSAVVSKLFDQDEASLQRWRDEAIRTLKDDVLTERRIRTALLQKADLAPWLDLLSPEAANKQEWRYWQAINREKQGQSARGLLESLSQERGFYPMLAAATLGVVYQPHFAQLSAEQRQQALIPFKVRLAQLQELHIVRQTQTVNSLWQRMLDEADNEQKIALADYANEHGWYDIGVQATIAAKAWDYISARLPLAYDTWFKINLTGKTLPVSFAQAIARQESAWNPSVISSADARGLMQLLPSTAKQTADQLKLPYNNANQLFSAFDNIMLGTAHLQQLSERFEGNRILIASAYNAGSRRVEQWLTRAGGRLTMAEFIATIPYYETRGYVQNVLAYDYYYQLLRKQQGISFAKREYDRLY
ncbi:transglycosylase SLT domain-containing protein [Spirabiliibacterium falconis]|uniref:transglycosylase SLT domain-containing protein n=1 Tax=Spirabiliibacterium falconis TaxID=572023 RepID=UPI001AACE2D6|nr:transglycosylase SLT domain-containing protein [Spirabiliibacterium falconis]MBE2895148.1 transglycosylase SLT domain-containing protein [Spirabiliibacterium falconis]